MSLLVKRDQNGLNRPFRSIFSDLFDDDLFFEGNMLKQAMPAVNVKESDKKFVVELAVPGKKKEDFKVNVENGVLTISSEQEESKEEKEEKYTRKEFSYSAFQRSFTLPENVNEDKIDAKYKDGVLGITIPKKEASKVQKPKEISIQ